MTTTSDIKPRIFINMHYMEIGGAERALLGLLNAIDTSKYDVDLFLNQHSGELMNLIPPEINLLPPIKKYTALERPITTIIREGHIDIAIARVIAKIMHRIKRKKENISHEDMSLFQYVAKYTTPLLPAISNNGLYDLAISFLAPHNIIKDKILAKQKWAWIHTDYSAIEINTRMELPVWKSFDKIISISSDVTDAFCQKFPSLKEKVFEIENIIPCAFIRQQAQEYLPAEYDSRYLNFCSVGRYSYAKNYDNIPFIADKLKSMGLKFHWYIIGYGDDTPIVQNINKTSTSDCVFLIGKKNNPYPYISQCDIYLQPSRYEGKSVTVREAQILKRPVIITNYQTSSSQVINGIDGIICKTDNDSIADAIYNLALDKDTRQRLTEYLSAVDYSNESEINKLYSYI